VTAVLVQIRGTGCPVLSGVTVGVQRGREVVDELPADGTDKRWTVELIVVGGRDLRGPYIQGRPGARFVYLSWQAAGEGMFRRAKLMLDSLPSYEDQVLTVGLTMPDGSPVCAAVRPPAMSWQSAASPR
jgi:Family of unknown function (DUF5990)